MGVDPIQEIFNAIEDIRAAPPTSPDVACLPCYYRTGIFFLSTCRHTDEDRYEAMMAVREYEAQDKITNEEFLLEQQRFWRTR